jgi:hypothetical protein
MAINPFDTVPEPGHEHLLVPYSENRRPDRILQIWSRCLCGLEEKRTYALDDDGDPVRPLRVDYRLGGSWMTALDLIRRRAIPVDECPACRGRGCDACFGLGVVEGDGPVREVRQATVSAPAAPARYDEILGRLVPLDDNGFDPLGA